MSDIAILRQMIKDDVLVKIENEYDKFVVKLIDSGCSVSIKNLPQDTIVIKADKFPVPQNFFIGEKGECKRADFIIISEEKKVILFLELKGNGEEAHNIIKQLKGAKCVLAYCKAAAENFWQQNNFLVSYHCRYVGFTKINMNKKPTRQSSGVLHDSPEKFLKISFSDKVQFNQLASLKG